MKMSEKSENRNLMLFFLIAFAWSWFFWMLQIWGFNLYVAPFGPFLAAFLLIYLQEGYEGVRKLLIKGFDPRIGKVWYVPAFLLWPVYIFFLGGPLQEKFGWRGYALTRFQARHSALVSSMVLGVIWAVWHLPLNFMYWLGPQYEVGLAMFMSTVILFVFVSILFTWFYNNTGGSIFAALIFHTMLNLSTYVVFPVFEVGTGPTYYFFSIIVAAIIILAIFGAKRMVREKSEDS